MMQFFTGDGTGSVLSLVNVKSMIDSVKRLREINHKASDVIVFFKHLCNTVNTAYECTVCAASRFESIFARSVDSFEGRD
jgi:hypothetical protein